MQLCAQYAQAQRTTSGKIKYLFNNPKSAICGPRHVLSVVSAPSPHHHQLWQSAQIRISNFPPNHTPYTITKIFHCVKTSKKYFIQRLPPGLERGNYQNYQQSISCHPEWATVQTFLTSLFSLLADFVLNVRKYFCPSSSNIFYASSPGGLWAETLRCAKLNFVPLWWQDGDSAVTTLGNVECSWMEKCQ